MKPKKFFLLGVPKLNTHMLQKKLGYSTLIYIYQKPKQKIKTKTNRGKLHFNDLLSG